VDTFFVWLKFCLCVLIILVAGRKVARYGDVIATKTGLGGLWIGLLLISIVTSLPELFNGISSSVLVKAPDLTVGDIFGSNVVNLLILAVADVAYQNGPLLSAASTRHLLPAGLSMALVGFVALCVLISARVSGMGLGWIGVYTPIIVFLYLIMMRMVFRYEKSQALLADEALDAQYDAVSSTRTYLTFAVAAAFVIGAGTWLAYIGQDIAEVTGWGQSFVGSLFIAITTSLPEISVSFAALQIGAVDMCIADIIGSNMFNMVIIAVDDVCYREGPILAAVSESHFFTGLVVLAMTCLVMAAVVSRTQRKTRLGFSWYVPLMIGLFAVSAYLSYTVNG